MRLCKGCKQNTPQLVDGRTLGEEQALAGGVLREYVDDLRGRAVECDAPAATRQITSSSSLPSGARMMLVDFIETRFFEKKT